MIFVIPIILTKGAHFVIVKLKILAIYYSHALRLLIFGFCVMFILMSHLPYHLIQVCIFVSIVFFMVATSQIGSGGMCGVLLCGCSGIVEVKLFSMVKPLTRSRF